MSSNGIIPLVKDRARVDNGFRGSDNIFHDPSLAIAQCDRERRDPGIRADDIDAVEPGRGGDALGIDGEVAVVGGLEEAAEAFVADHGFVALPQGLVQSGESRFAGRRIVAGFGLVVADDVAATARVALAGLNLADDLLDLKVEGAAAIGLGNCHRNERGVVGQHGGDLNAPPFAHARNILDPVGFERGDGLGADHAAIRDDADAMEPETLPQPGNDRYQCRHVGGIARPHLAADRSAVLVNDDADNHLMQVGPGVFGWSWTVVLLSMTSTPVIPSTYPQGAEYIFYSAVPRHGL